MYNREIQKMFMLHSSQWVSNGMKSQEIYEKERKIFSIKR